MLHTLTTAPSCSIFFHAATLYPIFTTKLVSYFSIFGCFLAGLWYSLINTDFEFIPPILACSFMFTVFVHAILALYAIEKNNLFFMYFYTLILVLFQISNCISFILLIIFKFIDAFKSAEIIETDEIYKFDKYDHTLDNNTIDLQVNVSFLQILSCRTLIFTNLCLIIFGFWYLSVLNHCLNKMKALQKLKTANNENNETKVMIV